MKTVYVIYHGLSVPYARSECATWKVASRFIKDTIDAGGQIHSVKKEQKESVDEIYE